MQRGKIFTAVAWGLGGLFLCAAAAVGFATQDFGLAELPDPQPEDWAQAYTTTWDTEEDPVRGLDISWFHGPVELRVGEGQYVTVTEEAQQELPEEDRLELTSSAGCCASSGTASCWPWTCWSTTARRWLWRCPGRRRRT